MRTMVEVNNQSDYTGQDMLSKTNQDGVSIIPLGGLGEVGMNCLLYEAREQIMIVDCGICFPSERAYGIDCIIPDFGYLLNHQKAVAGVVLTHGHEDHIGAIPYLLRDINPPIYATPFTLELVKHKLKEHGLYEHATLHEVSHGEVLTIGPFEVEFIHVNHSIPQASSLAIRTHQGLIVHSGDFKVDHQSIDNDPIDLARFAALGEEGVLCLLSDSTNVEVEGSTRSETEAAKTLKRIIQQAPGRVIVTMFASNVHRIQTLLDIAHHTGRRVLMLGRSLRHITEIARGLGILNLKSDSLLVESEELGAFRHDQLLILTTGSQGEPRSALTRIAMEDHSSFKIVPGDYVLYSSRVIPGNEVAVGRVCNHLYRLGAEVFQYPEHTIHASGHAYREELKLMLNLVQPEFFVPIHGEYRHLVKHALLAEELSVSESNVLENGETLTLWADDCQLGKRVQAGRIIVDGKGIDEESSVALRDRRKLARNGIVVVWLVMNLNDNQIVHGPELMIHGIIGGEAEAQLLKEATTKAREAVEELNPTSRRESAEVGEAVRLAVRRCFNKRIEIKPVVIPVVYQL